MTRCRSRLVLVDIHITKYVLPGTCLRDVGENRPLELKLGLIVAWCILDAWLSDGSLYHKLIWKVN